LVARKRRNRKNALVEDLIHSCAGAMVTTQEAQKATRALCRWFGGQMAYIPAERENGSWGEKLRGVLADAVGDGAAAAILEKIMRLYGGMQIYFPMERNAFSKTIALEIFERHGSNGITMNDLAREYGISFAQAYRLWGEGQAEKLCPTMPYLPFLELAEGNNSS